MMAQGKAILSLIFYSSVIGSSEKAGWTFTGLIGCDKTEREPGVSTETKLTLPVKATVGADQGTADVVVDVIPEQ